MSVNELLNEILELPFGAKERKDSDRPAVVVPLEHLKEFLSTLKSDKRFNFDMLLSHTAVDYPKENRIELVYHLFSTETGNLLMITTDLDRENPVAPTVCDLWAGAEYMEREVFDFFGVLYDNHPDLRRLFLEDNWEGYPLRKDYEDDFMLKR